MNRRQPIGGDLFRTVARAKGVLDPQALARIGTFVGSCAALGGGFRGRGGQADLYYTPFGGVLAGVLAVPVDRGAMAAFLDRHDPAQLDLPHLAALAQGRRLLSPWLGVPRAVRAACLPALARFRRADGGVAESPDAERGSAYGLYLALLCCEALGVSLPDEASARGAAEPVLTAELAVPSPLVSPVVAAALSMQALGVVVPGVRVRSVLESCRGAEGGFRAHLQAPAADLLSTAVACFALRRLGAPVQGSAAAATAGFVQSLWDAGGGFRGTAADRLADCEYTFYAMLALGSLEP